MIALDVLAISVVFLLIALANTSVIFALWWIIGQPLPLGNGKADYVGGRIFSCIGAKLVGWYDRFEEKEERRIKQLALDGVPSNSEDKDFKKLFAVSYAEQNKRRRPNPAKAFGVCPMCAGTYVSLLLSIILITILGVTFNNYIFYLSPLVVIYQWAISLALLNKVFLS